MARCIDPAGGAAHLQARLLHHVSDAFREDPVRILRVARFAARFHDLGFRVAPATLELMRAMVAAGEAASLVPERVWQETASALAEPRPDVFFEVLRDCGALRVVFPEVDALFGVPQPAQWHPEIDTGVHVLTVPHGRLRGCPSAPRCVSPCSSTISARERHPRPNCPGTWAMNCAASISCRSYAGASRCPTGSATWPSPWPAIMACAIGRWSFGRRPPGPPGESRCVPSWQPGY